MVKVIDIIKEVAKKNNIKIDFSNVDAPLKKLNIDSLASMNLIMEIEEKLGVTLDDSLLLEIKTLKDLIQAFENAK